MPEIQKYLRFFRKPETVTYRNYDNFLNNFQRFDSFYKDNIPTERIGYIEWTYDESIHYDTIYDTIIINLSKYLGTKAMYRDCLIGDLPTKGYWFIGDSTRISIMYHIWDYLYFLIRGYLSTLQVRQVYKGDMFKGLSKMNSSRIVFQQYIDNINNLILELLEVDLNYTIYLEKFILINFKLNFKKYKVKEYIYDHSISARYKHLMMML